MYQACIFDLDGTLTDTLESLTISVNETLRELGQDTITAEQCRSFVGDGARCLMERALKATGDEKLQKLEQGMEVYGRVFARNCTWHVKPYPGIVKMLKELKRRGIKTAVISNKPHAQSVDVVQTFFGKELFDHVQGQKEGVPKKPDPAAVLGILKEFGIRPEDGIYIGDSDVDMKTGKAAGMYTVGVCWGFRTRALLEETGADCTIEHAEELLTLLDGTENTGV
ncbi:MAG TPA: HAD family hydrolase [Candidatus Bariatricus faecipullorum]|nr:HAD family hydrolase [Candidatus Bariatricus faecipullorum]